MSKPKQIAKYCYEHPKETLAYIGIGTLTIVAYTAGIKAVQHNPLMFGLRKVDRW